MINIVEYKVTNNRMRQCGHVLRMNEERIPRKVLNMKVKGKYPGGRRRRRWEERVMKDITQEDQRTWKETEKELWGEEMKIGSLGCEATHIKWEEEGEEIVHKLLSIPYLHAYKLHILLRIYPPKLGCALYAFFF
jgi:hypothetical protein